MAEFNEIRKANLLRHSIVAALLSFGALNVVLTALSLANL